MVPGATLADLDHVDLELRVFRRHFVQFWALLDAPFIAAELVAVDVGDVGELDLLADRARDIGRLTVELGRARLTIENLLRLNQGSVVELNQVIGEPLSILVNNKLMAHGEAVVVKDRFAIRILDVVSPERRIESLR